MAASNHLLMRSLANCMLVCSRRLRENPLTGFNSLHQKLTASRFTIPRRWQHAQSQNTAASAMTAANSTTPSASDAEKHSVTVDSEQVSRLLESMDGNMPVQDMANPYEKEHKQCILCKYDLDVDYKNVRLLSQFVSPYTGRIYGRAVTGLCIPMQKRVARCVKQARQAGFMPYMHKKSEYVKDPHLFDPFRPAK